MFGLRGGGRRGCEREGRERIARRRAGGASPSCAPPSQKAPCPPPGRRRRGSSAPRACVATRRPCARGSRRSRGGGGARARGTPAARMTMPKEPRPSSTPSLSVSLLIFQSFISRIFMPRHLALHPRTTGWTMASDDARARSAATLVRVRGSCGPYARRSTRVAGACCGRTGYLALQSTLRLCCPRLQG